MKQKEKITELQEYCTMLEKSHEEMSIYQRDKSTTVKQSMRSESERHFEQVSKLQMRYARTRYLQELNKIGIMFLFLSYLVARLSFCTYIDIIYYYYLLLLFRLKKVIFYKKDWLVCNNLLHQEVFITAIYK